MTSVRASEIAWSYPSAPALDLNGPTVPFRPFREDWIDRPAVELFRSAAKEFGDHIACQDLAGHLTYAQVWAASRRLAHMIDTAVPEGQPVGVLLPNEAAYPVAVLACLAANRPCVMIDRHHPEDRVAAIVRDAGLGAIILRQSDGVAALPLPVGVRTIVIDEALQDGPIPDRASTASLPTHQASFIVYTSGSTGRPKGIVLSQRAVLHRARQLVNAVHLRPDDKVLSLASPSTIGGLQQIFEVMLSGATLVKLDLQRTGLGLVLRTIAERRLTMMFSTPAVWRSVAGIVDAAVALATLRCIQTSGDALLAIDLERLRRVLPADCHVLSVYGATEAPALLQWFVTSKLPDDGPRVPAGYPLPGFALSLLDDAGNPVSDGEPGELVVKSSWMSLGIWGNGAVQPGPFEQDRRDLAAPVYRTGDIVLKRPDGLFVTLGRKDRQVKILGNRVEPAEVETALRRAPEVADAAVVARRIEGDARLLAFFVPRAPGSPDTVAAVRGYLKEKLPAHMQPSQLFEVDQLPLLPGRKVDEEGLLAHAARHAVAPSVPSSVPVIAQPTQPSTEKVKEAWRRTFGRPAPEDGSSFDEAGGDSLRLLLLILHLERLSGRSLPLDQFQGGLKPADFALVLDRLREGPLPELRDTQPMVFLVPGKWGDTPLLARFRMACAKSIRVVPTSYPDLGCLARGGYEDIVAHLVAQIEQFAPDGAILLAGYSLGGDFAYAVADRLSKRGRRISALLVLDTDAEPYSSDPPAERRSLAQRLSTLFGLVRKRDWGTLAEAILTPSVVTGPVGLGALRFLLSFRLPGTSHFAFRLTWHLRAMLVQFHRGDWVRDVPPTRSSVPVVLFRSEEGGVDLGWDARTDKLTVVPVPGDHVSMLDPENSQDLVAEFNRAVHIAWSRGAAGHLREGR
jgi:amino acid adenylation domain-containing protein